MIYWPNGSFLVVKCSEETARELFFGLENIDYTLNWPGAFMFLSLCGTIFLMVSVIALANATVQLQLAWAAAYVSLNIGHWVAAALPRKYNWDFSAFEIKEQSIDTVGPNNSNYTEALYNLVLLTKSTRWIKVAGLAPDTDIWDEWLRDAEKISKTVGSHEGPLINSIWGGDDPSKGTVWDYPANWKPKEHWDRILKRVQEEAEAAQAV